MGIKDNVGKQALIVDGTHAARVGVIKDAKGDEPSGLYRISVTEFITGKVVERVVVVRASDVEVLDHVSKTS